MELLFSICFLLDQKTMFINDVVTDSIDVKGGLLLSGEAGEWWNPLDELGIEPSTYCTVGTGVSRAMMLLTIFQWRNIRPCELLHPTLPWILLHSIISKYNVTPSSPSQSINNLSAYLSEMTDRDIYKQNQLMAFISKHVVTLNIILVSPSSPSQINQHASIHI